MAELILEHVGKHYSPGVAALDDLSLCVADGELVVLVGPSGCGKTTTLRLVAGLETPTAGTIRIGGTVVNGLPPRLRDVALVFQRPTLYPHLSVADNLAFGVRMRRGSGWWRRLTGAADAAREGQDLAARVADAARALGLADVLGRLPAQLSGGQQQRVALGRALVRRPAAFLLDEPLSNLDPRLRHEMRRELHLLQRRLRATMLYVTHDQVEAMTLGDRVVVLDRGTAQQVGRPLDLYERPANRFVAGFIGWPPMNFLDGAPVRRGGAVAFAAGGLELSLSAEAQNALAGYNGDGVTAGIRPEYVVVGGSALLARRAPGLEPAAPARAGNGGLVMDVLLVEPLGATSLVTLGRDGRQLLALADGRSVPRERQAVEVGLDMRRIHVFDRSSGRALAHAAPFG